MTIYVLASEERKTYGHGDFGTEMHVCRENEYLTGGRGQFPPAFRTREAADAYVTAHPYPPRQVLTMELLDE